MDSFLLLELIAASTGTATLAFLAAFSYPAIIEKIYAIYKSKWDKLRFTSFRGQHFKHVRRGRIIDAILTVAETRFAWRNTNPKGKNPATFEITVSDTTTKKKSRLFLRCTVETFGKFCQIHYEWSCDQAAIKNSKSVENLAVLQFVDALEKSLAQQELYRSRFSYKLAGSRIFTSGTFSPEIVRHILNNATSIVDLADPTASVIESLDGANDLLDLEGVKRVHFRASPERRKNPWSDLVEAYLTVENKREMQIRFYSIDRSASGVSAWELICDWSGSLEATLDVDSAEWQIVQALFALVLDEMEKAKVYPCSASNGAYSRLRKLGIFEAWDYKVIDRALRALVDDFTGPKEFEHIQLQFIEAEKTQSAEASPATANSHELTPEYSFMRFQIRGRNPRKKKKPFPELLIRHQRTFSHAADAFKNVFTRDLLGSDSYDPKTLRLCFQFIPHPPRCGEIVLGWDAPAEDMENPNSSSACLLKSLENKLHVHLQKCSAREKKDTNVWTVEFLQENVDRETLLARASWPTMQDFNEALQSPELCIADPELKLGEISVTTLGIPKAAAGAFASVYKVSCDKKDWALRCFNFQVKDQLLRYEKASKFICDDDLPFTVACEYVEKGLLVGAVWYPVIKMEWVEGIPFSTYIAEKLEDKDSLVSLRSKFKNMMAAMKLNDIAHGDLQHGNIIIRDDEIVLVDYDNFFVPELAGMVSLETGHRNYQHPLRNGTHFGSYLDTFSAWVIDSALLALIHDPQLWHRFGAGEENLLFTAVDFMDPNDSELFQLLLEHEEAELSERARLLMGFLEMEVAKLPSFS